MSRHGNHPKNVEHEVARKMSGTRSHASGATEGNADVTTGAFAIECKAPLADQSKYRLTVDVWTKAIEEAKRQALMPAMAVRLDDCTLYGVAKSDFLLCFGKEIMNCHMFTIQVSTKGCWVEVEAWKQFDFIAKSEGRFAAYLVNFQRYDMQIVFMDEDQFKIINERVSDD